MSRLSKLESDLAKAESRLNMLQLTRNKIRKEITILAKSNPLNDGNLEVEEWQTIWEPYFQKMLALDTEIKSVIGQIHKVKKANNKLRRKIDKLKKG